MVGLVVISERHTTTTNETTELVIALLSTPAPLALRKSVRRIAIVVAGIIARSATAQVQRGGTIVIVPMAAIHRVIVVVRGAEVQASTIARAITVIIAVARVEVALVATAIIIVAMAVIHRVIANAQVVVLRGSITVLATNNTIVM